MGSSPAGSTNMKISQAPWTEEQVISLKITQRIKELRPYTCVCGELLIPTESGWVCNKCSYAQDWCFEIDLYSLPYFRLGQENPYDY